MNALAMTGDVKLPVQAHQRSQNRVRLLFTPVMQIIRSVHRR
jgi:hypothetical protein